MTVRNSLTQMVAITILATSVIGFASYNVVYGATDQNDVVKIEAKKKSEAIQLYFNRGKDRQICKDMYDLLLLPQNAHYLYSKDLKSALDVTSRLDSFHSPPLINIPNDEFKGFSKINWTDVSMEEGKSLSENFTSKMLEDLKGRAFPKYHENYKIQRAAIDVNDDGVPEAVYHTVDISNNSGQKKEYFNNYILIFFGENKELEGLFRIGQLVLYNGEPVFITREMSLTEVIATPALEDGDIFDGLYPPRKFVPLGCTFSSVDKSYLGD